MSEQTPLSIGIVALHALPAIRPDVGGAIGGTETRAWLLARGLAAAGHTVRFIVRSGGQAFTETIGGVTVVGIRDRWFERYVAVGRSVERTGRGVRIKTWSWRLIYLLPLVALHRLLVLRRRDARDPASLFDLAPADVWLTFGVQSTSAGVIAAAHRAGRPAVLMLGCDADVDRWFRDEPDRRTPYGDRGDVCAFILDEADRIVGQSGDQLRRLEANHGRDGFLLPNPIELSRWTTPQPLPAARKLPPRFVLWIGRAEPVHKRPIKAIDIIKYAPDVPLVMILNPADPATKCDVRQRAGQNVTIISFIEPRTMPAVMQRATALLNTSSTEGFPNTFLQAAACGVPIVTRGVLEDWLAEHGNGHCITDKAADSEDAADREAAALLTEWINNPEAAAAIGDRGRPVAEQHAVERIVRHLAGELRRVVAANSPNRSGPS